MLLFGWFSLLLVNSLLLINKAKVKPNFIKLTPHILVKAARQLRSKSGSQLGVRVRDQSCVFIYEGTVWHSGLSVVKVHTAMYGAEYY